MFDTIFTALMCILALISFIYSSKNLFKKGMPLYFQIIVCALACLLLEKIAYLIEFYTDALEEGIGVFVLGIMGSIMFLFSANLGILDRLVDDGNKSLKAKLMGIIAALIIFVGVIFNFMFVSTSSIGIGIILAIVCIPAVPAAYFNVKHLLLPMDPFELLMNTRAINVLSIIYYLSILAYMLCYMMKIDFIVYIFDAMYTLSMCLMGIFAVKGAKRWMI